MSGTLYGIGVGPGDPELITLKALRLLQAAPVIAWPAPPEGESLARKIAAPHITHSPKEIAIRMPLEVTRFPDRGVYDEAATEIGSHLRAGQNVVALCEGDPFFYGSFMYLYDRVADHHPVIVVPGVSSLMAAAAASGSPLASRNDMLSVVPAPLPEDALSAAILGADSAAIIKVGRHLGKVRRVLAGLGLAGNARYIEHATMPNESTCPLSDISDKAAPYFSMILVHRRGTALR
ncbi:MAG: precorrin-2 C(20)-methyltransferase [Alphaproteobacteria bacterium]